MSDREGAATTEPRRHFLGFEEPVGAAAAILLASAPAADGEVDLSAVTVVVPGGRARRQLLRELVEAARRRGLRLVPPDVTLPHDVELRVVDAAPEPIATDVATALAWAAALQNADEADRALLAPAGLRGLARRLGVARRLLDAHREIQSACATVEDVARSAEQLGADGSRYLALGRIAAAARSRLAELGLVDADAARARALERPLRDGGPVFLLATVDLAERTRRAVARLGERLHVLCIAPAGHAERFDVLGNVLPDAWLREPPHVPLDRIEVEDGPLEQAEAVVARVAGLADGGRLDPDRCAVVLADDELVEPVARELVAAGVGVHDARGVAFARLPPARVLIAVAAHLREATTQTLRSLLSEPAFERAVVRAAELSGPSSALAAFDRWLDGHHDRGLGASSFAAGELEAIDSAAGDLIGRLAGRRPLGAFASPLLALLGELYPEPAPAEDRGVTDGALAAFRDQLAALSACPVALQPDVDASDAIDAVLATLAGTRIREVPRPEEMDLVGWLELPFDPATDVVVAGANDGRLPAAPSDPFLPDALRRAAGLPDDRRRTARDAWILAAALARGSASFVLGRRGANGDPLTPSRLLTTGRGEELARRVIALTAEPARRLAVSAGARAFGPPPAPSSRVALDRIRVTAFRRYLESPYHFWLEQILGLAEPEPAGDELDARGFGIVVHAVLEEYGRRDGAAELADPGAIELVLHELLDEILEERAGASLTAGLRIQRRILRERLGWFAGAQGREVRAGWRIRHVERKVEEVLEIPDDTPITLVGKVDRIDYHERDRRWRILDYKTSDTPKKPDIAHRAKDGRWRDLQLPLYRHLLAERLRTEASGEVEIGYFDVAANRGGVQVVLAEKLRDATDEAVDEARRIVRAVRAGELALPEGPVPFERPGIGILCRTPALQADDAEEDA